MPNRPNDLLLPESDDRFWDPALNPDDAPAELFNPQQQADEPRRMTFVTDGDDVVFFTDVTRFDGRMTLVEIQAWIHRAEANAGPEEPPPLIARSPLREWDDFSDPNGFD